MARGGKREGAGRKPTPEKKKYVTVSISGAPEQIAKLKELAKDDEVTLSKYIINRLLEQ